MAAIEYNVLLTWKKKMDKDKKFCFLKKWGVESKKLLLFTIQLMTELEEFRYPSVAFTIWLRL